jgi:hypothetical protein
VVWDLVLGLDLQESKLQDEEGLLILSSHGPIVGRFTLGYS